MNKPPDCTCDPHFETCRACAQRAGDERLEHLENEARRNAALLEYILATTPKRKPQ